MAQKKHGRRAASTPVKTPLTELTEALSANSGVVGRRAAVVAAAGGLMATAVLPAATQGDEKSDAVVSAEAADSNVEADFSNQAATVIPEAAEDTEDDAALPGTSNVSTTTSTAAPEPEPEPAPAQSSDSTEPSDSSDRGSSTSRSTERSSDSSDRGSSTSRSTERSSDSKKDEKKSDSVSVPDGSKAEQVIAIAKQYVGVPYVYGGTTPSGWDCSGYIAFVYDKVGVNLPRTSGAQKAAGTVVSASEAKPGDLVFSPGHIGIYAGNGMMYDAGSPSSGTSYRSHSWMGSVTYIRVL
ncbi:C40 family peptidase [Brevibacterium sp. NPDC049920]|uniref:NlpC/P60 domain-containing protein n=1 Tax=Brevibacterium pityocampae TaxID=506594 RepID=A0ABP8J4K9_9MICO